MEQAVPSSVWKPPYEGCIMAKILVVEDDTSMNKILVDTLEDFDQEVHSALDGLEALELCEQHKFDLVLTDVRLPGMDGVEAISKIRKLQPKVKCIVITGYASADTPVRAIRLQVDDYLFKPFSLKYFLDAVNRVLTAEKQKKGKWALFQKVFSIIGPSKDRELEKMVLQRQEAFRGLFVGTRSDYLSVKAACEVYIKLELLEEQFRPLLNTKDPDTSRMRVVRGMYAELHGRLADFKSGSTDEATEEGVVPLEQFRKLYQAIKDTEIGLDELQYAPLLRKTPDERFETLQEMLELKRKLWPDLSQT